MKKTIFLLLFFCRLATASNISFNETPTAWTIENYTADNIVVWFSPSVCANGMLTFPSGATVADRNRFYATVMAAKLSNTKMFVIYDGGIPNCPITSFGMQSQLR